MTMDTVGWMAFCKMQNLSDMRAAPIRIINKQEGTDYYKQRWKM